MQVLASQLAVGMVVVLNGETVKLREEKETTPVGKKWRVWPFGEAHKTVFIPNGKMLYVPHGASTVH